MTATAKATIQVAFIDDPDPPKRIKGRVKDTNGDAYTVDPIELGKFEKGRFYDIEYKEFTFKGGGKGKSIEKITPRPVERPQVVQQGGGGPAPQPGPGPTLSAAELHFVTAIIAAKISSCQIGREDDLAVAIHTIREQYRRGFGARANA